MVRRLLLLLALAAVAGCSGRGEGALKVAFIDEPALAFSGGARLSPAAQHLRAATRAGLVAFDEQGSVVPALADRWIVTDDGLSYIFRLRDGTWPDSRELTAMSVRTALVEAIGDLRGTSLALDLAPIAQIRAMAGRVVEIRLSRPLPSLLTLLAQPELGITRGGAGKLGDSGPMILQRREGSAILRMKRPADRGLPEEQDWSRHVRPVEVQVTSAQRAIDLFGDGEVDVVLGGRLESLPLAPTGPLSRGTVHLDPVAGLFGLQVRTVDGFLAEAANREAVAMALDRAALIAPFNIGGWEPTTRIAPPGNSAPPTERWAGQLPEALRDQAAARVARWRASQKNAPLVLTVELPPGPGSDILFQGLAGQLTQIGITLQRAASGARANLTLIDRVARYPDLRWYLDQFACSLRQGPCDAAADELVAAADQAPDPATRANLLVQAEARLTATNLFIPLGSPVRFSLVRSRVTGFAATAWGFHPLPPLAAIPK